jgi:hypothetical protein
MTDALPTNLVALRDSLHRATRADLARRRPLHRRPAVLAVALALIALPGAAVAATQLISTASVAQSLPQGTKALIGTDPSCSVVVEGSEYHCILAAAPTQPTVATSKAPAGALGFSALAHGGHDCKLALLHHVAEHCVLFRWRRVGRRVRVCPANGGGCLASRARRPRVAEAGPAGATGSAMASFDWTGTVEPTVDASLHVNGGCRAENAAGTDWECYIGAAAVAQNIISQGFLGQYAPVPGVG